MRGFESLTPDCVRCTKAVRPVVVRDLAGSSPVVHPAQVTQRIECQLPKLVAEGSIPSLGTARYSNWQRSPAQTRYSVGSNPTRVTPW